MAQAITWSDTIDAADLGTAPTALTDNNVVENTDVKDTVAISSEFGDGTSPTMTVTIYFWDALAAVFYESGDTFLLDPATANLAVMNPNGLPLGFTATVTGGATIYELHVGTR